MIVAAARDAFAAADLAGTTVSMNEIARRAHVGAATLYRHFPTREALAEAVYRTKFDELTTRARATPGQQSAHQALTRWVNEFVALMLPTQGMMDALRAAWLSGTAIESAIAHDIRDVMATFIAAGRDDGTLRQDVDPMDITVGVIALLSTATSGEEASRARRLLAVFTDTLAVRESDK